MLSLNVLCIARLCLVSYRGLTWQTYQTKAFCSMIAHMLWSGQDLPSSDLDARPFTVYLQEVAVLYRRACGQNKQGVLKRAKSVLTTIGQRIGVLQSAQDPASSTLRPQISLQIYRDIPLPTWSVVLPEKVLQFRPLDFLRTDLFAISGLIAALAQVGPRAVFCLVCPGVRLWTAS